MITNGNTNLPELNFHRIEIHFICSFTGIKMIFLIKLSILPSNSRVRSFSYFN